MATLIPPTVEVEKFYTTLKNEIRSQIDSDSEELIVNADTKELVDYYCSHRVLTPIEIDNTLPPTSLISKSIDTRLPKDFKKFQAFIEGKSDFEIETLTIEIPIKTNHTNSIVCQLFIYLDDEKSIKLNEEQITIKLTIKEHSSIKQTHEINEETNRKKDLVYNWLRIIQQNIASQNEYLISDVKHCIERRRLKILATRKRHEEIIKTIKIPLKKKEDAVIKQIRLDKTPLVKRIRPNTSAKENYVLDRQKVLDIIHVLDNQGRQFEKTPYSYKLLGEDDLRNILLVNLNSIFEGRAIGEAFSNVGKTDITLNIDKGNILIIECKIWGGSRRHLDAVTQLISYLTWRHNYGIVVNFCRVKDMSKIIKTTTQDIKTHSTFIREGKETKETHFSTVHQSPSDSGKLIEIHHIFYNLFTKDENS